MPTSGSVDFSIDRSGLIAAALEDLGVLFTGQSASAAQLTQGAIRLNLLIKAMGPQIGLPLWALKVGYILPIADTNTMLVTSHCVNSYTQTTIDADEAAGQTALTVASISGISASNVLGVELDDGTIHWTTVNGAPSGTTVTATTALPSAASSGNIVYAYATTARITRPLRVVHANVLDVTDNTRLPVEIVGYADFADLSLITSESYPTQLYYNPQLVGEFNWYPRFGDGNRVIVIRYHRPFEDFDSAADTPDFPSEWFYPIQKLLTWALAGAYNKTVEEKKALREEALFWLKQVTDGDAEDGSVRLEPNQFPGSR